MPVSLLKAHALCKFRYYMPQQAAFLQQPNPAAGAAAQQYLAELVAHPLCRSFLYQMVIFYDSRLRLYMQPEVQIYSKPDCPH